MFEVGKTYEIHTLQLGEGGYYGTKQNSEVTRVEGNLVELDGHEIINTASPTFERAIDVKAQEAFRQTLRVDYDYSQARGEGPSVED